MVLGVLLLAAGPSVSQAQPVTPSGERAQPETRLLLQRAAPEAKQAARTAWAGDDRAGKDGPMAKAGLDLATLYHQHALEGAAGVRALMAGPEEAPEGAAKEAGGAQGSVRTRALVSADGNRVTVHAVARSSGGALLGALRGLGLRNGEQDGALVSGQLPIRTLREAAALTQLRGLQLARVQTHIGSVTSQADRAHGADDVRQQIGVLGEGIKICAMSDSYDNPNESLRTRASDDVESGDLPGLNNPNGYTTPVDVLDDDQAGGDEGRAMLQHIHDLAPGATLGYHTAFGGVANFANGIRELADSGCEVIVDDVRYNIEPFYQDGRLSQAVDEVVENQDVAYFTSAGNDGENAYQAPFRDSGEPGVLNDQATRHDFNPSSASIDTEQEIKISVGGSFGFFSFQWSDPSAAAGPQGPSTDLDVALITRDGEVVANSQSANRQTGLPVESIDYVNSGNVDTDQNGVPDSTFYLVIERFAGPAPDEMKYVYSGRSFQIKEYDPLGATIYGHSRAENAISVAASFYFNTAAFNENVESAVVNDFSSRGSIPVLFNADGTRRAEPLQRQKPDVTGTDAANTTFFGSDFDDDGFPNFVGTSAAAPHVAAIGGLIRSANPALGPESVYQRLETTAADVTRRFNRDGQVEATGEGYDFFGGNGFVRAFEAVDPLLPVRVRDLQATAPDARPDPSAGQRTVQVTWETTEEQDSEGFVVEYNVGSLANRARQPEWQRAGFVPSAADQGQSSEPLRYNFEAAVPSPGRYVFRIRHRRASAANGGLAVPVGPRVTVDVPLEGDVAIGGPQPNPFRGRTTVEVVVRESQDLRVAVYNAMGRRVQTLYEGQLTARDPLITQFDAQALASGVYFVRVEGETISATRQAVLVR
jgi:hypothetical protein